MTSNVTMVGPAASTTKTGKSSPGSPSVSRSSNPSTNPATALSTQTPMHSHEACHRSAQPVEETYLAQPGSSPDCQRPTFVRLPSRSSRYPAKLSRHTLTRRSPELGRSGPAARLQPSGRSLPPSIF
ncbi:hypothetical protein K466DRAFT_123660 [Polyporus arcularius HHB13444]|uniref:Uncharacterized protein n=1 Tax=Polyporus arcularius HHB13444 TaxID=1314778 RepID=A0A5C3PC48_9APHY|nr:hypothetical protein K466DRAFT_123660 [Polyporus arcularius HHB13444]